MERINLYALYEITSKLEIDKANRCLNLLQNVNYIDLKVYEFQTLDNFIKYLIKKAEEIKFLRDFYIGFKIAQIGKEFDLLKLTDEGILNIELKSRGNEEDFKNQLIKNSYYLKALSKPVYLFTYNASGNILYELIDGDLVLTDAKHLLEVISLLINVENIKIDDLFNPNLYLISPLNNTKRFLMREYFLTLHQFEIKNEIIDLSKKKHTKFFSISGKPGTGKTLLLFDLALDLANHFKVCFIHCGILSKGHQKINDKTKIDVFSIKVVREVNLNLYNYIIFDETQRMFGREFSYLQSHAFGLDKVFIFSYDSSQVLSRKEIRSNTSEKVENIENIKKYNLKNKIRTNPNIITFIQAMFELDRKDKIIKSDDIKIYWSRNQKHSLNLIKELEKQGYKYIKYTPSFYEIGPMDKMPPSDNTHEVLGQEFDKVLVIIDDYFYYDRNVLVSYRHPNPDYLYFKMLYQSATRAKNMLAIIVQENKDVLTKLMGLLE